MATYAELANKKNELIRRARDGSVFVAPRSADPIEELTSGAGAALQVLPTGFVDLGWTSTDGVTYGRETESSQIRSFGSTEPTREDIITDTITMSVTAQETNLVTIGLSIGSAWTGLEAAAVTGELSMAKPKLPSPQNYQLLGLFVDETADGPIYFGRYMPNARVTEFGETVYTSDGDDPIQYSLTFTGFEASDLGYSHRWIWAGPGWLALLDAMGIEQETVGGG